MKASEWIARLEQELKKLSKPEKNGVISYYKEMIADVLESGVDEEEFIFTLGNPCDVASKILSENGVKYTTGEQEKQGQNGEQTQGDKKGFPFGLVLILGFFGVVVGLPLFIVGITALISLFITFWACFGAMLVASFACLIAIFIGVGMAIVGMVQNGWALVGACVLGTGAVMLLSVGFWYLSVYTTKLVIFCWKKLVKGGKRA